MSDFPRWVTLSDDIGNVLVLSKEEETTLLSEWATRLSAAGATTEAAAAAQLAAAVAVASDASDASDAADAAVAVAASSLAHTRPRR